MDKGFAKRLNTACDGHPHVPPYGQGRQTWLRDRTGVSAEAVRKWFSGDSRPRPDKMRILSKLLNVDEAWLSLGITPGITPSERRGKNTAIRGTVNLFMGLLQINDVTVTLPDDKDPRGELVDFYAVIRAMLTPIHITQATKTGKHKYKLIIPINHEQLTLVGGIHVAPFDMHWIKLDAELVTRHRLSQGGYFELEVHQDELGYHSGEDRWSMINNPSDL